MSEAGEGPTSPPESRAARHRGTGSEERELTEREREILTFEREWWKYAGAKESAVRERFDLSPAHYYQVLNALIDHPGAVVHDALLVRRLRRLRITRQRQRSARRLGRA